MMVALLGVIFLVLLPLGVVLNLYIGALVYQILVSILVRPTDTGFGATFRVYAYTFAVVLTELDTDPRLRGLFIRALFDFRGYTGAPRNDHRPGGGGGSHGVSPVFAADPLRFPFGRWRIFASKPRSTAASAFAKGGASRALVEEILLLSLGLCAVLPVV